MNMNMQEQLSYTKMADYHLEEFMRCPYKFYNTHTLEKKASLNWRQMVQYAVNHVLNDYYSLPSKSRSTVKILEFIHNRWKIKPSLFDSKFHSVFVLATVTDQLLAYLSTNSANDPPLFLFESFSTKIDELQLELSMIFQIVEWSQNSFIVKKVLVDHDIDVLTTYTHMTLLFCHRAFQRLPEKIEVFSLLSGKKHIFRPTIDDVVKAMDYMRLAKNLLHEQHDRKTSSLTECNSCPFNNKCEKSQPIRKTAASQSRKMIELLYN